jgi:nitrogen regulatory protein PII
MRYSLAMKVEGDILTFKLDAVKQTLGGTGLHQVTITQARAEERRSEDFLPRIRVTVSTPDDLASRVADVLAAASSN